MNYHPDPLKLSIRSERAVPIEVELGSGILREGVFRDGPGAIASKQPLLEL